MKKERIHIITNLPCGCSTIPIKKFIKVKEKLLAGKAIITDNPEIEESEIVFFQFKDGNVFSVVMLPDDTQGTANFNIKRAIEICKELWDSGYDFCYGEHMSFSVSEDGESDEGKNVKNEK